VEEACEKVIHTHAEIIEPIKKNSSLYAERYEVFKELYRRNKDLFLL
jgi:xylulokinase